MNRRGRHRCFSIGRSSTATALLLLATTTTTTARLGGGTSRYLTLTLTLLLAPSSASASPPSLVSADDGGTTTGGGRNGGEGRGDVDVDIDVWRDLIEEHYPAHYVVHKLRGGSQRRRRQQRISIDGKLDEEAWEEVPWLQNFLDLAGPRYSKNTLTTANKDWRDASREYSERLTGFADPTRVKVRWDDDYLYVGAEMHSRNVHPTVVGHCSNLTSDVWSDITPVLPYFDDDFEFFVNPSTSNYHYVEFEINGNNATYQTLWTLPQSGLGSVAPECGGAGEGNNEGPRRICCNTTWNAGRGLCDKPNTVEVEGEGWTMEMYDVNRRPGDGMKSAVVTTAVVENNHHLSGASSTPSPPGRRWTLEVRFPILSTDGQHGGLINTYPGSYYPGTDPTLLHPARGRRRYWWATFATALHPTWWDDLNSTSVQDAKRIRSRCQQVIEMDEESNGGYSQFLIDGNNAATTCYYESSSWHLGGHRYMHNPDNFGYLEFSHDDIDDGEEEEQEEQRRNLAEGDAHNGRLLPRRSRSNRRPCRDVRWPARFVLSQIYQAQVAYLTNERLGNGTYATTVEQLLLSSSSGEVGVDDGAGVAAEAACTIENACNVTALSRAVGDGSGVRVTISTTHTPASGVRDCVRYAVGKWQSANWTGGPCFSASVEYVVAVRRRDADAHASSSSSAAPTTIVGGVIDEARHMRFFPEVGRSGWKDEDVDSSSSSSSDSDDYELPCLDDVHIVSTGSLAREDE